MIGNTAMMKIQIARICPNFFTFPSAFVDEKRTKYPITVNIVAGIKLKTKHIDYSPFLATTTRVLLRGALAGAP